MTGRLVEGGTRPAREVRRSATEKHGAEWMDRKAVSSAEEKNNISAVMPH